MQKKFTSPASHHESGAFFVGHVYGQLVDESVGLKEIKDCKSIGQENPYNHQQLITVIL